MALRDPTWEGFTLNNKLRQYDVIGVGVNNLGSMWDLIVSVPDHCLSFYFENHISWQKTNFLKDQICVSYVLKQQNVGGGEWLSANREIVFFLAESNVKWKQLGKWPLKATC